MSQVVTLNNDQVITIGDINMYDVGNEQWFTFMNAKSTPINLTGWKNLVADYPTSTIYTSDRLNQALFDSIVDGTITEEDANSLEKDGYWLVGDYINGGLVIFNTPNSNQIGWLLVRAIEDCGEDYINWFYYGNQSQNVSDGDGDLYITFYDQWKVNGTFQTNFWTYSVSHNMTWGKWSVSDNRAIYTTDNVPTSISITSIESDDFVTNLLIYYKTYYISDGHTVGAIGSLPSQTKYSWWDSGNLPVPDPNAGGGYSSTGGGDGSYDTSSDTIPIPDLPPDLLLSSGIIKMYYPTPEEMSAFTNFIYASPLDIVANFKKIWANPMDSIITLGTVPFNVATTAAEEVKFCGVPSGISMKPISSQYIQIDCGTKKVDKFWDTALDYNNYTKMKLFLPFIGFVDLNTDDANGAEITVKYNIDLYTGDALAFVYIKKTDYPYGEVKDSETDKNLKPVVIDGTLYVHKGNVLQQVPLTGSNYQGLYSGIMNLATRSFKGGIPGAVAGIGAEVLSQKVDVDRSGSLSPNAGELGIYTPFLVIDRPIQSLPVNFMEKYGYPSNIFKTMKNLEGLGYVQIEVDSLILEDLDDITDEEVTELKQILESGVIL